LASLKVLLNSEPLQSASDSGISFHGVSMPSRLEVESAVWLAFRGFRLEPDIRDGAHEGGYS
jgi:hypothetical protein